MDIELLIKFLEMVVNSVEELESKIVNLDGSYDPYDNQYQSSENLTVILDEIKKQVKEN